MSKNKRPIHVLVLDDEEGWRDTLSIVFQDLDDDEDHPYKYKVDTFANIQDTEDSINDTFYHIWILDLNMIGPLEIENIDGLNLLAKFNQEGMTNNLAVFMISGYLNIKKMRAIFTRGNVLDVFDKGDFDDEEFVKVILTALDPNGKVDGKESPLKINPNLDIVWRGEYHNIQEAVAGLRIDEERVRAPKDVRDDISAQKFAERIAAELDDIFCRLFYDAETIFVRRLGTGFSGALVFLVEPIYQEGQTGRTMAVKIGDVRLVAEEFKNYRANVEPYIAGIPNLSLYMRTAKLAGISYSFLEGHLRDSLSDFASFYQKSSVESICQVLDTLLTKNCNRWYSHSEMETLNLRQEYSNLLNMSEDALLKAFDRLRKDIDDGDMFNFRALAADSRYPNAIHFYKAKELKMNTRQSLTHGDMNDQNILIDQSQDPWLIDFRHSEKGHLMRDFAKLDTVIRTQMLSPESANLEDRRYLEQRLNSVESFRDLKQLPEHLETHNEALKKAYRVIRHLRLIAKDYGTNHDSMDDYYAALFYFNLNTIRYYPIDKLQKVHGLLAASLLVNKLNHL